MKIVLAVMALFAIIMLAGCEQKPGYMIEGYLTSDYYLIIIKIHITIKYYSIDVIST